MDDYISRQAAIEVARENGKKIPTLAIRTMEAIKSLPAADVAPVVRCRECKYYEGRHWCGLNETDFYPDDFCSYGERKE